MVDLIRNGDVFDFPCFRIESGTGASAKYALDSDGFLIVDYVRLHVQTVTVNNKYEVHTYDQIIDGSTYSFSTITSLNDPVDIRGIAYPILLNSNDAPAAWTAPNDVNYPASYLTLLSDDQIYTKLLNTPSNGLYWTAQDRYYGDLRSMVRPNRKTDINTMPSLHAFVASAANTPDNVSPFPLDPATTNAGVSKYYLKRGVRFLVPDTGLFTSQMLSAYSQGRFLKLLRNHTDKCVIWIPEECIAAYDAGTLIPEKKMLPLGTNVLSQHFYVGETEKVVTLPSGASYLSTDLTMEYVDFTPYVSSSYAAASATWTPTVVTPDTTTVPPPAQPTVETGPSILNIGGATPSKIEKLVTTNPNSASLRVSSNSTAWQYIGLDDNGEAIFIPVNNTPTNTPTPIGIVPAVPPSYPPEPTPDPAAPPIVVAPLTPIAPPIPATPEQLAAQNYSGVTGVTNYQGFFTAIKPTLHFPTVYSTELVGGYKPEMSPHTYFGTLLNSEWGETFYEQTWWSYDDYFVIVKRRSDGAMLPVPATTFEKYEQTVFSTYATFKQEYLGTLTADQRYALITDNYDIIATDASVLDWYTGGTLPNYRATMDSFNWWRIGASTTALSDTNLLTYFKNGSGVGYTPEQNLKVIKAYYTSSLNDVELSNKIEAYLGGFITIAQLLTSITRIADYTLTAEQYLALFVQWRGDTKRALILDVLEQYIYQNYFDADLLTVLPTYCTPKVEGFNILVPLEQAALAAINDPRVTEAMKYYGVTYGTFTPTQFSTQLQLEGIPVVKLTGVAPANKDVLTLVGAYATVSTEGHTNYFLRASCPALEVFNSSTASATSYSTETLPISFEVNTNNPESPGYVTLVFQDSLLRIVEKEVTIAGAKYYTTSGVVSSFVIPKEKSVISVGVMDTDPLAVSLADFKLKFTAATLTPHVLGFSKPIYIGFCIDALSAYASEYSIARPVLEIYDANGSAALTLDAESVVGVNYPQLLASSYRVFKYTIPTTLAQVLSDTATYGIRVRFISSTGSLTLPVENVPMNGVTFNSLSSGTLLGDVPYNTVAPTDFSLSLATITKQVSAIKFATYSTALGVDTVLSAPVLFNKAVGATETRSFKFKGQDVQHPVTVTKIGFLRGSALPTSLNDYVVTGGVAASAIPTAETFRAVGKSLSPLSALAADKEIALTVAFTSTFKQTNATLGLTQNKRSLTINIYGTTFSNSTESILATITLMATVI